METNLKNNNADNSLHTDNNLLELPLENSCPECNKKPISEVKTRGSHQVRRTATRLKVLEAGIKVLGEKGYHAATTTMIAKQAGVSRGALLHQFPTHSELMFAIVQHVIAKQQEHNANLISTTEPGAEQFKSLTTALWRKSKSADMMALIEIHMASRSVPELSKSLGWRVNALIRSEVEHAWHLAQEAGIKDKKSVEALSTLTIASIWGLSILRLKLWNDEEINDAYQLLQNNLDYFVSSHNPSQD